MYYGDTKAAMEDEGRTASGSEVNDDSELVPVNPKIIESGAWRGELAGRDERRVPSPAWGFIHRTYDLIQFCSLYPYVSRFNAAKSLNVFPRST